MWTLSSVFLVIFICVNCEISISTRPEIIIKDVDNNTVISSDNIQEQNEITIILNNSIGVVNYTVSILENVSTNEIQLNRSHSDYLTNVNDSEINTSNTVDVNKISSYYPDAYLDTVQLIVKYGYPAESHTVKTEDGYILTIHRIPHGKLPSDSTNRQPVFLQHGLLGSSSNFITSGVEKGLAYILADAGYDVWMGNFRGNTYSRAHVTLSIQDSDFWNFSWDECAAYDLPAMIDYVNNYKKTNNLLYVGHSMGTTTLFALLSTRLEYNSKMLAAFTLAPVTYLTAIKSPIRLFAPFANNIEWIAEFLGANEFFPQNAIFKWLGQDICEINHYSKEVCLNIMFLIAGYDEKEFNKDFFKVIIAHTPAGTSTRTVVHFAQEIRDRGKFQKFDHGAEENMKKYGQKTPPEYQINNITLPIALFCGDNDWLAGSADSKRIYKEIKNPIEYYVVPMKDFNHLDFLWATDAPTLVYNKLLELLTHYK